MTSLFDDKQTRDFHSKFRRQEVGFAHAEEERAKAFEAPFQKFKTTIINTNRPVDAVKSATHGTSERDEDMVTAQLTEKGKLLRVVSFSVDKITLPLSFETINFTLFRDTDYAGGVLPSFAAQPDLLMVFAISVYFYRQNVLPPFDYTLLRADETIEIATNSVLGPTLTVPGTVLERGHWSPTIFANKINDIMQRFSFRRRIGNAEFVPNQEGLRDRNFPLLGSPRSFRVGFDTNTSRFEFSRAAPIDALLPNVQVDSVLAQLTVVDSVKVGVRSSRLAAQLGFGALRTDITDLLPKARTTTNVSVLLDGARITKVCAPLPIEPFGPAFLTLRSTLPVSSLQTEHSTVCVLAIVPLVEGFSRVASITPTTEFESVFSFKTPETIESTQSFWFEDDVGKKVYFISDRRWSVTLTFKYIP